MTVLFRKRGDDPKVHDDLLTAFELPLERGCSNQAATEARGLLKTVLQSFPESRVAANFHKVS